MLSSKPNDDTQCHKLFHTKCTINNNIFDLIINSGCQKDIIGKDVVNMFKLPIKKYSNPYNIGWIMAVDSIKVSERCMVPFSIGRYRNEF